MVIKLVSGRAQDIFLTQPWVLTAALSNMPNFKLYWIKCVVIYSIGSMFTETQTFPEVSWAQSVSIGYTSKPYAILIVLWHDQTYRVGKTHMV